MAITITTAMINQYKGNMLVKYQQEGSLLRGATTVIPVNAEFAYTETLAQTDVFLPNGVEARAIAGEPDVEAALSTLAKRTPLVAVKLGAEGAIARRGEETVRAAPPPVQVVDTTGAGDSFDAGFVCGYLKGWPLERTLRLACACGSLATRQPGGTNGQPTLAEALAIMEGREC